MLQETAYNRFLFRFVGLLLFEDYKVIFVIWLAWPMMNLYNFLFQKLCKLSLKELYCEENELLRNEPVYSVQEREVLTLKVS